MTKIAILKSRVSRLGGAEKYAWRLAQAFRERQCQVTVLTTETPASFSEDPLLKVVSHALKSKMSFRKVQEYDRFCLQELAREKIDIAFGLDRNSFQTHLRASNGVHAAYLKHRQETDSWFKRLSHAVNPLHRTLINIEKNSFENPQLEMLFTNSHMVRSEILEHYKTDPKKIRVIHNGVEWAEMADDFTQWQDKKMSIAQDFNLDPSFYHFLFIGHNYRRKGLEKLLYALSSLPTRDFHLSVVGQEKNTRYFIALAHKLNLTHQVRFFGKRTDIRTFYQLADALVIPSFYDPFANVTVEALAMGLFVVSSKTNGGHEILTSQNGTVIESLSSIDSLADSLKTALRHPKTKDSSLKIRESVRHLDFSHQLSLFTDAILA